MKEKLLVAYQEALATLAAKRKAHRTLLYGDMLGILGAEHTLDKLGATDPDIAQQERNRKQVERDIEVAEWKRQDDRDRMSYPDYMEKYYDRTGSLKSLPLPQA